MRNCALPAFDFPDAERCFVRWGWRLVAVVVVLVLLVFGVVKGGYVYSAVVSLLGIFLLVTSFLHPSSPEDPRWRIRRLRCPVGVFALCYGLVIFLNTRRLLSVNARTVLGLSAFVAMMFITFYLWRALAQRK